MPRAGEHPETVKDHTSAKITEACKLISASSGLPCYRYAAIDRAMDLLLAEIKQEQE